MRRLLLGLLIGVTLVAPTSANASHTGTPDRDCGDFSSQSAAQSYFIAHGGPSSDSDLLDGDGDGIACESLPCPCTTGSTSPSPPPPPAPPPPPPVAPAPAPPPTEPAPRSRERLRAKVTAVVDGDTIKVRTSRGRRLTVRLIGIDTPETKKPGTPVECGGAKATANMKRLSFKRGRGRSVVLTTDPTQSRSDRYGRLLAYAKVDSGKTLQLEQIKSGWSAAYVYEKPFERLTQFHAPEGVARGAGRGVWGMCGGNFHLAPGAAAV